MRCFLAACAVSLTILAGAVMPVPCIAEDAAPPAVQPNQSAPAAQAGSVSSDAATTGTAAAAAKSKTAAKQGTGSSFFHMPRPSSVASMIVGGIAGIPVAMVRHTKVEIVSATKELVDNSSNPWLLGVVSPLGFCGGVVSGVSQGLLFGPYNAYKFRNEPFSPQSFSLRDAK